MAERTRRAEGRFYAAIRHADAADVGTRETASYPLSELMDGHRYCLLVSYTRDGRAIPTPVWFAADGERLVFESDADCLKLKRIGRNASVRISPCTMRGKPLGAPLECTARVMDTSEEAAAEEALAGKYGRVRGLAMNLRPTPEAGRSYVEVRVADGAAAG